MTLGEKLTKALSQNRVHLLTTFGNGLLQVPSPKVFGDPCTLISATKLNQLPSSKLFGNHLLQLPSPLPSQRRLSILTTPNYVHSHSLEFGILSHRRFPSTLTTANFRRGDSLYSHNGEFQERSVTENTLRRIPDFRVAELHSEAPNLNIVASNYTQRLTRYVVLERGACPEEGNCAKRAAQDTLSTHELTELYAH